MSALKLNQGFFQACCNVISADHQPCTGHVPELLQPSLQPPTQSAWETLLLCPSVCCALATTPCRCLQCSLEFLEPEVFIICEQGFCLFLSMLLSALSRSRESIKAGDRCNMLAKNQGCQRVSAIRRTDQAGSEQPVSKADSASTSSY